MSASLVTSEGCEGEVSPCLLSSGFLAIFGISWLLDVSSPQSLHVHMIIYSKSVSKLLLFISTLVLVG